MTYEEMKEYLLEELQEQKSRWLMGKENNFGYIFMLCNDIGIVKSEC